MIGVFQTTFQMLSHVHNRVYFERAPEKDPVTGQPPSFPYAVFKIPNSVDLETDRQDFVLEIDIWDNQTDTARLETLTSSIDKKLHKLRYLDSNQLLIFQRTNRLMIPDPDVKIKRRQLRYIIKTYER